MLSLMNAEAFLHQAIVWLQLLVTIGGVVICYMHRRLSSRMWWVAIGLMGQVGVGIFYRTFSFLGLWSSQPLDMRVFVLLGSFVGLLAWITVIAGLAGVFSDIRERLRLLSHKADRAA